MKVVPSKTTNWRQRCRALERLAEAMLTPLGLRHERTRLRKLQNGRPTVDTVFQSDQLHFSKWHVRCEDALELTLDQAATEVGIAQGSGSRVALLITTGTISAEARRYARIVNATTPYNVVLLRHADALPKGGRRSRLARLIRAQAPLALTAAPQQA